MIKEIHIKNVQSVESATINPSCGITAITGPSDSGKSAILRAVFLAVQWGNSIGLVRDGHRSLRVSIKSGVQTVQLERGSTNSYRLNGQTYAKSGTGVPAEVVKALNIDPASLHRQHDGPFLLSLPGAEKARVIAELTQATVFLNGVREANRRRMEADRAVSGATLNLNGCMDTLATFGSPDELRAKSRALKAARAALTEAKAKRADLARFKADEQKANQLTFEISQLQGARQVDNALDDLLGNAKDAAKMVEAFDEDMRKLDSLDRAVATLKEKTANEERKVHELLRKYTLVTKEQKTITCDVCGNVIKL